MHSLSWPFWRKAVKHRNPPTHNLPPTQACWLSWWAITCTACYRILFSLLLTDAMLLLPSSCPAERRRRYQGARVRSHLDLQQVVVIKIGSSLIFLCFITLSRFRVLSHACAAAVITPCTGTLSFRTCLRCEFHSSLPAESKICSCVQASAHNEL